MRYITINNDRYGGGYSSARWTAWFGESPDEIDGDDPTCQQFWWGHQAIPKHGKGDTPALALQDLIDRSAYHITDFDVIHVDHDDPEVPAEERFIPVLSERFAAAFPKISRD